MVEKKDLELISSSAKAMAKHFKAFEMVEKICNEVLESENRLSELKQASSKAEVKLKSLQGEIEQAKVDLNIALDNDRDTIIQAKAKSDKLIQEFKDKERAVLERTQQNMDNLRVSEEKARKEIEILIETKKKSLAVLEEQHSKLMLDYARQEAEAIRKVEKANAELEKARNFLNER